MWRRVDYDECNKSKVSTLSMNGPHKARLMSTYDTTELTPTSLNAIIYVDMSTTSQNFRIQLIAVARALRLTATDGNR